MSARKEVGVSAPHVGVIDIIRGLAALSVAFYHTREILWVGLREFVQQDLQVSVAAALSFLSFPFVWGSVGVPIFFVLSGYVIHRRAARGLAIDDHSGHSSRLFLSRRLIRIYPTLVAALILTLCCDTISQQYAPLNDKLGDTSSAAFLWNMLALNGLFSPSFGSNGALWTLALEIQFYAIYPMALVLRRRIGADGMLLFTAALSAVGFLTLEMRGLQAFPAYYFSWWIGAYVADREAASRPLIFAWPALAFGLAVLGAALVVFRYSTFSAHTLWSVAFAFVCAKIVQQRMTLSRGVAGRLLAYVGDFSYSLYVVHMPIVVMISSVLFMGVRQQSIYVSIGAFVLVVAAAFLFHLVVERPSMRWLARMRGPRG